MPTPPRQNHTIKMSLCQILINPVLILVLYALATVLSTQRNIGAAAEQEVSQYYLERGFTLLVENFASFTGRQVGEIDIIFKGPGNQQHIRFVEVKARSSALALSIDVLLPRFKRRRIAQTARYFMYTHPEYANCYWHFDLAVVKLEKGAVDNSCKNITIVSDVNLD